MVYPFCPDLIKPVGEMLCRECGIFHVWALKVCEVYLRLYFCECASCNLPFVDGLYEFYRKADELFRVGLPIALLCRPFMKVISYRFGYLREGTSVSSCSVLKVGSTVRIKPNIVVQQFLAIRDCIATLCATLLMESVATRPNTPCSLCSCSSNCVCSSIVNCPSLLWGGECTTTPYPWKRLRRLCWSAEFRDGDVGGVSATG